MNNIGNEKAITLISLVITIIVLIILSSISINIMVEDNGIIDKSKETKFTTQMEIVEKQVNLYKEDKELEKKQLDIEKLPIGEKVNYNNLEISTLKNEIQKYNEDTNQLYYIDKEKANIKKIEHNYIIAIKTMRIYDVEGEKFLGEYHHTINRKNTEQIKENVNIQPEIKYDIRTNSYKIILPKENLGENIESYKFIINGEEKGEPKNINYSDEIIEINDEIIKDLNPEEKYEIEIILIDKEGNKTKAKTIIKEPIKFIIREGKTENEFHTKNAIATQIEKTAQSDAYINIKCNNTTDRATYSFDYDLTKYKKIYIDAEVVSKEIAETDCRIFLAIIEKSEEATGDFLEKVIICDQNETSKQRDIYSISAEGYNKEYSISYLKNGTRPATSAEINIYNLWLEE